MFCKKSILKKFTGKELCWSFFLIRLYNVSGSCSSEIVFINNDEVYHIQENKFYLHKEQFKHKKNTFIIISLAFINFCYGIFDKMTEGIVHVESKLETNKKLHLQK